MYCRRLCGAYSDGMAKKPTPATIRPEQIERAIQIVRGQRVLLDADLAQFYGVLTKALNQAVRRNAERFPADFAFQLTPQEFAALRSQIVTSNVGRGGHRYRPWVFTEHGVAMLSSVLRSPTAVRVNVEIIRHCSNSSDRIPDRSEHGEGF